MSVTVELDEKLVAEIDAVAKDFKKNRLQYINDSLKKSLARDLRKSDLLDEQKVEKFIESYKNNPQRPEEYEVWENEQVWSES